MRKTIYLIAILLITIPSSARNLLNSPEGVVYDSVGERYLVANATSGEIVQINKYREQSYFTKGFSVPLCLKIINGILYVTTNHPTVLYGLDLNTAEIVVQVPIPEAYSLAGLDTDTSGYLYVIDQTGKLFQVQLSDHTYTLFISAGLPNGLQGLVFDEVHNRFVLCSYPTNSSLLGLNLAPLSLNTLAYTAGGCIPITTDKEHNYYYGSWFTDLIYKFDSAFTTPVDTFSSGHNNPTGLCFNKFLEEIAITNNGSSTIDFKNLFIEFEADTTWGWAPLDINFTPASDKSIDTWSWTFGDGGISTADAPSHSYETAGLYNVSVTVTIGGEEHTNQKYHYICILADSLLGHDIDSDENVILEFLINVVNNMPLEKIIIPIEYDGLIGLEYNGYSVEGCRLETYDNIGYLNYEAAQKHFTLEMVTGDSILAPGSGTLIKLKFKIIDGNEGDSTLISLDGYGEHKATFSGSFGDYGPILSAGFIKYVHTGCCIGTTGNVDCSEIEIPDISDITRLIDFLYISHNPLCCPEEADVNVSEAEPDIADITALIDHLYLSYRLLPDCP